MQAQKGSFLAFHPAVFCEAFLSLSDPNTSASNTTFSMGPENTIQVPFYLNPLGPYVFLNSKSVCISETEFSAYPICPVTFLVGLG